MNHDTAARKAVASINADEWTTCYTRPVIRNYFDFWKDTIFIPIEVEHHFTKPIEGSSTQLHGFVDTIGYYKSDLGKAVVNLEHKTGSYDANSDWNVWNNLAGVSGQIDLYDFGCNSDFDLSRHEIDYIKVPSFKSKKLPVGKDPGEPGTKSEVLNLKTYLGEPISDASHHFYQSIGVKENPELLEIRIDQAIKANPEKYYHRFGGILRNEQNRQETKARLAQLMLEQERAKQDAANGLDPYYKNSNSCYAYGSWCQYLNLCNGTETTSAFDVRKPRNTGHTSFSRLSVWNSCRRKYKHQYIDGLQDPEHDPNALRKGSVVHEALEVFYREIKEQEQLKNESN